MALTDDINNLPTTLGDGSTGHLANHQTIHDALKSHESRINSTRAAFPTTLAVTQDTRVGKAIFVGDTLVAGDSGKLNITSLLDPQPTSGNLILFRSYQTIYLSFRYLSYTPDTVVKLTLPDGFRVTEPVSENIHDATTFLRGTITTTFSGSGTIKALNGGSMNDTVNLGYTTNPWPTTVPV